MESVAPNRRHVTIVFDAQQHNVAAPNECPYSRLLMVVVVAADFSNGVICTNDMKTILVFGPL